METSTATTQPNQVSQEIPPITEAIQQSISEEKTVEETKINIYPVIRHIFLITSLLLAFSIIVFLIYQNGKSIYVQGI